MKNKEHRKIIKKYKRNQRIKEIVLRLVSNIAFYFICILAFVLWIGYAYWRSGSNIFIFSIVIVMVLIGAGIKKIYPKIKNRLNRNKRG